MSKLRPRRLKPSGRPVASNPVCSMTPALEHDLLQRLWNFKNQMVDSRDVEKVIARALRLSMEFFHVPEGCVAVVRPGKHDADILAPLPPDGQWDRTMLAGFLRKEEVRVGPDIMLSRVRRFGRMWGTLAVRCPRAEFRWDVRQAFSSVGAAATQLIEGIEEDRIREVRSRIDQKILEEISPKNLFYHILHGLRSLIGYDHSAALFTCDADHTSLELVGEQIAWRKAKSQLVGLNLPLTKPLWDLLGKNVVYGFNRESKQWVDWTGLDARPLAELLDYNRRGRQADAPICEESILCAPLATRHEVLGVLKVAALHAGTFGSYEADVIAQFLPSVAVAIQNMRHTESLRQRMHAAERQQAMADFARGVSHDVNNSLGAMLPLVQQMRADIDDGVFDPEVAQQDLYQIEQSLQICRRIFGGMLSFARRAARNASDVYLHQAVEGTLTVFRELLQRNGIEVHVDVPADLPALRGIQADVEQLLLNIIGNARDAMEAGGTLTIRASRNGDHVDLTVSDTGCGIPAANLPRVQEPFFTTKPSGSGLGLAICQSIVSQMHGKLRLESKEGEGTTVRVALPLPQESTP
jgi:two-component system NtrC family sensor kinase